MPALNFKREFAAAVESGNKRQTIRAYRKDGRDPKRGNTLYLYTGMRTKACRKLGEARCTSVREIRFERNEYGDPIAWRPHKRDGIEYLNDDRIAKRDGFLNGFALVDWFERVHGLPFEGLLIRW